MTFIAIREHCPELNTNTKSRKKFASSFQQLGKLLSKLHSQTISFGLTTKKIKELYYRSGINFNPSVYYC
jgi:hypothetical protein